MLIGPQLPPRSWPPKQLVVLLHGYCADGSQLIHIGQQWQSTFPDVAFVAPHAPEPCATASTYRQWFAMTTRTPEERWRGVTQAAPALDEFLDETLRRCDLDEARLALVGFSQGAEMALHVGLRRSASPAAIIGFSGMLIGPEHLDATVAVRQGVAPPILLVHGALDNVIPVEDMFSSVNQLARAGVPSEWHVSVGFGHEIDDGGLHHGCLFLAECFSVSMASPGKEPR